MRTALALLLAPWLAASCDKSRGSDAVADTDASDDAGTGTGEHATGPEAQGSGTTTESSGEGRTAATDGAPTETSPCTDYLSCLLLTCPDCYAAALTLYGDEAACWDTPGQTQMCEQACGELVADLSDRCQCSDGNCVECAPLLDGRYQHIPDSDPKLSLPFPYGPDLSCDDGSVEPSGWEALEVQAIAQRTIEFRVISGLSGLGLEPFVIAQPCGDEPFAVAGDLMSPNYPSVTHWRAEVSPMDNGERLVIAITMAMTDEAGNAITCTGHGQYSSS